MLYSPGSGQRAWVLPASGSVARPRRPSGARPALVRRSSGGHPEPFARPSCGPLAATRRPRGGRVAAAFRPNVARTRRLARGWRAECPGMPPPSRGRSLIASGMPVTEGEWAARRAAGTRPPGAARRAAGGDVRGLKAVRSGPGNGAGRRLAAPAADAPRHQQAVAAARLGTPTPGSAVVLLVGPPVPMHRRLSPADVAGAAGRVAAETSPVPAVLLADGERNAPGCRRRAAAARCLRAECR